MGEFLAGLKKEFRGDEKAVKVAELKKLEQEGRTMEEFMQEFKKWQEKVSMRGDY